LVSVRDPVEAMVAVRFGADVIDVKEPALGPLGRPSPEVAAAVVKTVGTRIPVSIALGELADLRLEPYASIFHMQPLQFAKVGLAGFGGDHRWPLAWHNAWCEIPQRVQRVGVVYVDWQAASAPYPMDAIGAFASGSCVAILFDTFTKNGQSLIDLASRGEMTEWTKAAREAAPVLVLAGSLSAGMLGSLRGYEPDLLAVRGAVCPSGRAGRVSGAGVRSFADAIKRTFGPINALPPH
jgi:uncharacterized protein (UPF0264 family)